MTEHGRQWHTIVRLGEMKIGMAEPARLDVDQYLPALRCIDPDILDVEAAVVGVQNSCLHTHSPFSPIRHQRGTFSPKVGV